MTDTIDVAALVERLRAADRPHLSDLAVSVHEHLCREAATALQSQADALAEARRGRHQPTLSVIASSTTRSKT